MRKAFLAVLVVLLASVSFAFAGSSLLRDSILASSYQELVEMAQAYGLGSYKDEQSLREALLRHFGLELSQEPEDGNEEGEIESVTSIRIDHADRMDFVGDLVVLSGGVKVAFSAAETGNRILTANAVAIDLNSKLLQASGDVALVDEDASKRTFRGQVVSLDWATLDVVVFDGQSTTTRSNSSGNGILFYVSGKEVSYDGQSSGVFFHDGTIATWQKDPYWSISADKLSLSGNDMFIDRAVFRLGRVPVFYFPIFFYPGTTLSFNPSIGLSSTKGAFMTTTYEVYGSYPGLGIQGAKASTSDGSESTDVTGLTAFLDSGDKSEMIRDGIYYRPIREGEALTGLESWARSSGSYMAIFADVYQNLGLSMGFDTMNKLLDKSLGIGATGVVAYRPVSDDNMRRLRYSLDFTFNYAKDDLKVNASLPLRSDPAVRVDFLNRNTAFTIDSLLGTMRYFPNTYRSQSTYTWSLDASYRKSVGNYNFNISSLKTDVDYRLDLSTDENGFYYYRPTVVEASIPYLSFSSDGLFLNIEGQSNSTTKATGYSNALAESMSEEQSALAEESGTSDEIEPAAENRPVPYQGPELKLEETSVSKSASFKLGYTYSQTLDNVFRQNLTRDHFYTRINSSIYADASAPDRWFTVRETLRPQFNYTRTGISSANDVKVDEFYLTSALSASVPRLGLSYNLNQRVYVHYGNSQQSGVTDRWGEWNSTDITAHNASFSKTFNDITFGFYVQLKPLTEILRPSLAFSRGGFNASADFSMRRPADSQEFEKDQANLNLSYNGSVLTAALANKYDFSKVSGSDLWSGYSLVQKLSVKPLKGLTFSENANFTGRFVPARVSLSGAYALDTDLIDLGASGTMYFTGENCDKDSLNVSLKLSQDQVSLWKRRLAFESALSFSFNYDFQNPFRSYLTASLSLSFAVAEFLDLSLSVNSANKSFSRYYGDDGSFSFSSMLEDLAKSFDFFGNGRTGTGFNLSSFKLQFVHYMRDWNLYIDAQGSLTTQYTGKYEWVPSVTVYLKWNAIPELRTQGSWDASTKEWT